MDALLVNGDVDLFGGELNDPLTELAQDLGNRLIEDPRSNPDDEDRGVGISSVLSAVYNPQIAAKVETDFRKDPRVADAKATVTPTGDAGGYRLDITVEADEGELTLIYLTDGAGGIVRVQS